METLTETLQYVCSQSRCFWIDESPLPVCQRCLGLYAGFALTVAWLGLSGIWRRGLAPNGVLALHVGVLLAAMAGGLHWIDLGPRWRLACGLWTGHVAALWIIGGLMEKAKGGLLRNRTTRSPTAWPRWATTQAVLALPLLFGLAASFAWLERLGWWFWTLFALTGVVAVFGMAALAIVVLATRLAPGGRARRREPRDPSSSRVAEQCPQDEVIAAVEISKPLGGGLKRLDSESLLKP